MVRLQPLRVLSIELTKRDRLGYTYLYVRMLGTPALYSISPD